MSPFLLEPFVDGIERDVRSNDNHPGRSVGDARVPVDGLNQDGYWGMLQLCAIGRNIFPHC